MQFLAAARSFLDTAYGGGGIASRVADDGADDLESFCKFANVLVGDADRG
jgi:hypothetical protein